MACNDDFLSCLTSSLISPTVTTVSSTTHFSTVTTESNPLVSHRMSNFNAEQTTGVNHIAVKLPLFAEGQASSWFKIVEAQFSIANITQESTKFLHVLSVLPPALVSRLNPTVLDYFSYEQLKTNIVGLCERTKPELFESLIKETSMTGRPSVFLHDILSTAQKLGVGDDLVRHKFIQALPSTVSPVVAAQKDLTLHQLGKLADELVPIISNTSMYNVQTSFPPTNVTQTEGYVRGRTLNRNSKPFTRSPSRSNTNAMTPFYADQKPKICRFHVYFGQQSRRCTSWCQWPNKASTLQIRPSSRSRSPISTLANKLSASSLN